MLTVHVCGHTLVTRKVWKTIPWQAEKSIKQLYSLHFGSHLRKKAAWLCLFPIAEWVRSVTRGNTEYLKIDCTRFPQYSSDYSDTIHLSLRGAEFTSSSVLVCRLMVEEEEEQTLKTTSCLRWRQVQLQHQSHLCLPLSLPISLGHLSIKCKINFSRGMIYNHVGIFLTPA